MMKAGRYWVGDICYVMHDEWSEVCNLTIRANQCLYYGEFTLKNGTKFAIQRTCYGDGVYYDQFANEYGVDAGLIGCILLEDIDQTNPSNSVELGTVFDFTEPFETSYNDGVIQIGHVTIVTDFSDEEDEEEDYE